MTQYAVPVKHRFPSTIRGRVFVGLNTEKDSGVKHTHLASCGDGYSILKTATDAIGSMTLTLTNVVVDSRYRIERQGDGSLATPTGSAEGVAASSTVNITLDVYAPGSANNDIRIKVRKASAAPTYKPFETLATLSATPQSIYVGQIQDE